MSGNPSLIGWGHQPFGQFPFGSADWSDVGLIRNIPEFYRLDDAQAGGRRAFPLLLFLESLEPTLNFIYERWNLFPELVDPDDCPVDQLRLLAATVGVELSRDKPEVFQRLEILNNPQIILNKGTDDGYQIAGSFEGLEVTVIPLYAETCEPDAALTPDAPDAWLANFDDVPADEIPLDEIYPERLDAWPLPVQPIANPNNIFFDQTALDSIPLDSFFGIQGGRCRAHTLRLEYAKPDDTEIEDYNNVSRRVVGFVERFRPTHVTIESILFDGPKASATWVESIQVDASAASSWTLPAIEFPLASTTWTADIAV